MPAESERLREAAEVEKWIAQARQNDREALGRLLEMCRNYLLLVANQELAPELGVKVAASDIVQDSLLEAGRDFPRFHGVREEELLVWLSSILRNNVANVRRHFETQKRQVSREVPLEDSAVGDLVDNLASPCETPSKHAQAREQDEQLEQALQQLPTHYRQVLYLYTTENLKFPQIAAKLGSTEEAIRKLWGRALEELSKQLHPPNEST